MWGPDLYVVPVTEKGQQLVKINFPDAKPWFNLFTDERILPNQSIAIAKCFWGTKHVMVWNEPTIDTLSLNAIPVFVKAGAFIPMARKGIQSTEDYSVNEAEIHFYYDPSISFSSGEWFEDDGISKQDFDGQCFTLYEFSYQKKLNHKSIIKVKTNSPYCKPFNPTVTLVIHNVSEMPNIRSRKNDKLLGYNLSNCYNAANKTLRIPFVLINDNELKIKFQ